MFPCLETKQLQIFASSRFFWNVCQYFVAIHVVCYKTQTKNCLSLAYATDLKCYCYYSSVLYCTSIGGCQCNKYCTYENVKIHRTIFVNL